MPFAFSREEILLFCRLSTRADDRGVNHTTEYYVSSIDGIRGKKDQNGETSYLTVAGKTIGDLRLDNKKVQHLDVYGGFTPVGTPETAGGMTGFMQKNAKLGAKGQFDFFNADKKMLMEKADAGTLPEAPQDNLGTYTLQSGDTLDSIALQVYGDSSLWYLLADANGITDRNAHAGEKGSQLHVGQSINIPSAGRQHHTTGTHKALNGSDVTGNLSATTPLPPAPPPLFRLFLAIRVS